ncbi:hypothetical protein KBA63_02985 [Candidatus Woesebacteria bacterium]|jgi:hypothetical protein|nr:hypothetical protein [Candidatus Woesebacteria bacterium]MBP9687230.1 hypothetical protein [Candidatus Woesebacteria bacterium]
MNAIAGIVSDFQEAITVLPLETCAMVVFAEPDTHSTIVLFHSKAILLEMKVKRQLKLHDVNKSQYYGLSGIRSMESIDAVCNLLLAVENGFNPITVEDWRQKVYS